MEGPGTRSAQPISQWWTSREEPVTAGADQGPEQMRTGKSHLGVCVQSSEAHQLLLALVRRTAMATRARERLIRGWARQGGSPGHQIAPRPVDGWFCSPVSPAFSPPSSGEGEGAKNVWRVGQGLRVELLGVGERLLPCHSECLGRPNPIKIPL